MGEIIYLVPIHDEISEISVANIFDRMLTDLVRQSKNPSSLVEKSRELFSKFQPPSKMILEFLLDTMEGVYYREKHLLDSSSKKNFEEYLRELRFQYEDLCNASR